MRFEAGSLSPCGYPIRQRDRFAASCREPVSLTIRPRRTPSSHVVFAHVGFTHMVFTHRVIFIVMRRYFEDLPLMNHIWVFNPVRHDDGLHSRVVLHGDIS